MSDISAYHNLGRKSVSQLKEIGISDFEQIRTLGVVEVYRRLRFAFGRAVTLNMLYALEGAVTGVDWRAISPERKAELKELVSRS